MIASRPGIVLLRCEGSTFEALQTSRTRKRAQGWPLLKGLMIASRPGIVPLRCSGSTFEAPCKPVHNSALVSRCGDSLQARDCSSALLRFRI